MKRVLSLLLAVGISLAVLLPGAAAVSAQENPVPKAKQSVVKILAGIYFDESGNLGAYKTEGDYIFWGEGTGFGVGEAGQDADTFVTNWHVVSDDNGDPYDFVYVCIDGADMYDESTLVKCDVLYTDSHIDIAVIRAAAPVSGIPTMPLRPSESMETGDSVYALGFPSVADEVVDGKDYTVEGITVTDGIVSRYVTSDGVACMAHTAVINHGNSGGPLINEFGQVIGINTMGYAQRILTEDGQLNTEFDPDKRYYAIYTDYAMDALDSLKLPYVSTTENGTGAIQEAPEPEPKPEANYLVWIAAGAALAAGAAAAVLLMKKNKQAPISRPGATAYYLYCSAGPLQGRSWALTHKLSIGRDPGGDVVLPLNTNGVSRCHCCVALQNGTVTVTDLNSSYGTFLSGGRLPANAAVQLPVNGEIQVGSGQVRFILQARREG